MPQFSYKARRRSGELVEDVVDVADRPAAVAQIERLGLIPVRVEAAKGSATPASRARTSPSGPRTAGAAAPKTSGGSGFAKLFQRRRPRPKLQELATFTQQLANLLKAGMPLTMALQSMSSLTSRGIPSEVAKQLKQDVTEGRSLSDAMSKQSEVFPPIVINMVRAGEQSGALEEVLRRQATHFERFAEVQAKFKSAMIYPLVVCAVGVALVVFFMTAMLPKFMTLFESIQGLELPATTRLLISSSRFLTRWWWLFPILATVIGLVFRRFHASPEGRRSVDKLILRLPIFGHVVRLNLFGQFARTLGTLLRNGVPVLQALRITEQIVSNVVVAEAVAKVSSRL